LIGQDGASVTNFAAGAGLAGFSSGKQ